MKDHFAILLIPEERFALEIKGLKKRVGEVIGKSYLSATAPAHLSICSFSIKAGLANEIAVALGPYMAPLQRVELLSGAFGWYESSGTVYLGLQDNTPFLEFQQQLISFLRNTWPSLKRNMSIPSKPHLTLGRGFKEQEVPGILQALGEYPPTEFCGTKVDVRLEIQGKMTSLSSYTLKA